MHAEIDTYIHKYKHTYVFIYLAAYIHKHNFSFGAPISNIQRNEAIVFISEIESVVQIDRGISGCSFHKTINDIVRYPLFYLASSFHGFGFFFLFFKKISLRNHCLQQCFCFCNWIKL